MYTSFWTQDLKILYDKNHIMEIFPSRDYDIIRKLNAVFRFSIYYAIIIYFVKRSLNIFYIPIVTGIITYLIFKKNDNITLDNIKSDLMNNFDVTSENLEKMNQECRTYKRQSIYESNSR